MEKIIISDAYENNLKHINLEIPLEKFTCVTGCSGCGKSSLVYDTIYAESQRGFLEGMTGNVYGQKLMDKPKVGKIENLRPALNISQNYYNVNPRSTIGTTTEIAYYLRSLFAIVNSTNDNVISENVFSSNNPKTFCPNCQGLGCETIVSERLLVPDKDKSLRDGGILYYKGMAESKEQKYLEALCETYGINIDKIQVAIATNGILLKNMEFCNKLVSYGVSYVDISLKGKDEEQCKALVGAECFKAQEQAIQNLSKLKLDYTCSMVLTKENIGSLCESVRNSLNKGAKQFSFTFVIDNEKTEYDEDTYWNINNPHILIEAFMMQVEELNSITEEWWIEYSFPLCVYTEEQLNILEGKMAFPCQIHNENGITFDTELNLIPCNMYFENKIGRLGSDFLSYEDFKNWMKNDAYRSVIDRLKEYPSEECKECSKLSICYGGCPVTWKNFTYRMVQNHK